MSDYIKYGIAGASRRETIHVEVTGWDSDNESISWDGYGDTEDEAIEDAKQRGGIVEIGDVRVLGGAR